MKMKLRRDGSRKRRDASRSLDRKLASYLAASASIGAVMATDAKAIIISSPVTQSVGINGFANIDFNSDGQTDVQIDHDRVDLSSHGGPVVDYLQVDKNDINGASPGENVLAFDPGPGTNFIATGFVDGTTTRNDANQTGYLVDAFGDKTHVQYPSALTAGAQIGPTQFYDYQEGDNVFDNHQIGRMGRLIDEDHGQVDILLGGTPASGIVTPSNSPQFTGVENQTRYVGVRLDLNDDSKNNNANEYRYGWVGIKITNEADATGQVVGWGYETDPGVAILAGDTGARGGDYNNDGKVDAADYIAWRKGNQLQNETQTAGSNTVEDYTPWRTNYGGTTTGASGLSASSAVPEPGSLLMSLMAGFGLAAVYFCRRIRGK